MADSTTLSWQANLLDPELLSQGRARFGGPMVPVAVAVVALAAVASFTQAQWRAVTELSARADAAESRATALKTRAGDDAGQKAAEQSLAAIEVEVGRKRALLGTLRDAANGGDAAWTAAAVLTTLSERHRDGLWLTRVSIDRSRRELKVEGNVDAAGVLSGWVAALGAGDGPLAGMSVAAISTGGESDGAGAGDTAARVQRFRLDARVLR